MKKATYYAIAVLHLLNIIVTRHIGLWLATFISVFAYLVIRTKRHRKELLLVLIALPYLLFMLPEAFFTKAAEFLGISHSLGEIMSGIKAGFSLIPENLFFGVGFGAQTPMANMALSMAMNFGVIVFSVFIIIFVLRLVQLSEYGVYMSGSLLALISKAGALAVFGLFSLGTTADVFADVTIYFLFIYIFGILSASLRISKTEYMDRLSYYGDLRSADSSDINVRIS